MHDVIEVLKGKIVMDKCYSLREVREAIRYLEEGRAQGKVVKTLEYNNNAPNVDCRIVDRYTEVMLKPPSRK